MPARPGAGRPSKDSPEKRQIILEAIQNKMPLYLACDYAMISRDSLHRWIKDDPDFAAQINWAKAKAAGGLIDKISQDANGCWKILKNLQPEHFKDEVEVKETHHTILTLEAPDGRTGEIHFNPSKIESGASRPLLREGSPNTSSVLGDTGGQDDPRSLLDPQKDK